MRQRNISLNLLNLAVPARPGDPTLAAKGSSIYEGIAGAGVPACATCHGPDARGKNEFPRLAGQHAAYLVKQLQSFRSGLPASPIMQPVADKLSDDDMLAVAAFLHAK